MMLDEASTMSASNVNERGDVRGTFSVGKALVLCLSGGSAAKHGVCGVAPHMVDRTGADPCVLLCPEGMQQEACGF